MQTINSIQNWMLTILWIGMLALQVWALADCISRKTAAFSAANKLTKPTWLLLVTISLIITIVVPGPVTNLLAWIALIVSSVYLADVRPAVKEISGPSRW